VKMQIIIRLRGVHKPTGRAHTPRAGVGPGLNHV
jgi:hypothetical protein